MEHLLPENGGNLAGFLAGTEGTLAVLYPSHRAAGPRRAIYCNRGACLPDMATAADAVPALLPMKPLALEGMDTRLIDVLVRRRGSSAVPVCEGGGWLFAETGETQEQALVPPETSSVSRFPRPCGRDRRGCPLPVARSRRWRRTRQQNAQERRPGRWEDAAVPPENVGRYLREFAGLLITMA
jgi:FAD/FMN-containing dehydrogenase